MSVRKLFPTTKINSPRAAGPSTVPHVSDEETFISFIPGRVSELNG